MKIICMRHAEYEPENGQLTKQGQKNAYLAGLALSRTKKIDALLCSQSLRAVQTAKMVAHALAFKGRIETDSFFNERNDCDSAGFQAYLESKPGSSAWDTVLVVTHLPNLKPTSLQIFFDGKRMSDFALRPLSCYEIYNGSMAELLFAYGSPVIYETRLLGSEKVTSLNYSLPEDYNHPL